MPTPTTTMHGGGPGNVFVPSSTIRNEGAQDVLQIEYSRAAEDFPVNQYLQVIPNTVWSGTYIELDPDAAGRLVNLSDNVWPDGQERPTREPEKFVHKTFTCQRHEFGNTVGNITARNAEQHGFEYVAAMLRIQAHRAMSRRVAKALDIATTAGNWPAASTSATLDALGVSSGNWTSSSASQNFIQISFHKVLENIKKNTSGAVKVRDVACVVDPDLAHRMGEQAEVIQYVTANEAAMPFLTQTDQFATYGLPSQLFGIRMIVEDTVRTTTRDGLSETTDFDLGDKALFLTRMGDLMDGVQGVPTLSTLSLFSYDQDDMAVEQDVDDWNKRTRLSIVDSYDIQLTSTASGYLLQDVTT